MLSSLDGITEQSQLCDLKLYAYKCQDQFKGEPANNFYLDSESFYASKHFADAKSAAQVRKEVDKMIKVANSPKLIKLINPARLHLNSEEELMVILELQEPPSVNVSVDVSVNEEAKQEVVEATKPQAAGSKQQQQNQATQKPSKKASKKQKQAKIEAPVEEAPKASPAQVAQA